MEKIAVYWGCFTPTKQYALELSTRSVFETLGVQILELRNSACCGYPYRGVKPKLWLYLSARILALAEEQGYKYLLPVCNGCYNSLLKTQHFLKERKDVREEVAKYLAEEGLKYSGRTKVVHFLEYLHDYYGLDKIKEKLYSESRKEIKVAAHYGCDALRPGEIPRFDNPRNPTKFENLIEALGYTAIKDYPRKLDCCGAPLLAVNPELALKVDWLKLVNAASSGANLLVTTCEYCFEMLDTKQESASKVGGKPVSIPVMYFQQLIGLALGLSEKELGLNFNMSPVESILEKLKR